MKKALIVLFVALLSLSMVFANGSKEAGEEKITLVRSAAVLIKHSIYIIQTMK